MFAPWTRLLRWTPHTKLLPCSLYYVSCVLCSVFHCSACFCAETAAKEVHTSLCKMLACEEWASRRMFDANSALSGQLWLIYEDKYQIWLYAASCIHLSKCIALHGWLAGWHWIGVFLYLKCESYRQATKLYVPVAPLLVECLQWSKLYKAVKAGSSSRKVVNNVPQLRAGKQDLESPSFQQAFVEEVCRFFDLSTAMIPPCIIWRQKL